MSFVHPWDIAAVIHKSIRNQSLLIKWMEDSIRLQIVIWIPELELTFRIDEQTSKEEFILDHGPIIQKKFYELFPPTEWDFASQAENCG